MDYRITVSENRQYVIIKYFVVMTTELAVKSGPELVSIMEETGLKRILFDLSESTNVQSVTDNYFFANKDIQSFGFPRNTVSAFFIKPGDKSHDFISTAFMNAGYSVYQFFSFEDAHNWLCPNG